MTDNVDIAVLKHSTEEHDVMLKSLGVAVTKISDAVSDTAKILAVHEERIDRNTDATEDMKETINGHQMEMRETVRDISESIRKSEGRTSQQIIDTEGRITRSIVALKEDVVVRQNKKIDENDERLGKLEKYRWIMGGGIAVILYLAVEVLPKVFEAWQMTQH